MPDYSKGKIYQIISPNYPLPYIGSTTVALCKRMTGHRHLSNRASSRIVIDAGDAYIELIEEFPCENKEQLNKREGEVIRERECVNRQVAGRTPVEYRAENRDFIIAISKVYYEANHDAIKAKQRAYYEANRDAIKAKQKAYRSKKNEVKSMTE